MGDRTIHALYLNKTWTCMYRFSTEKAGRFLAKIMSRYLLFRNFKNYDWKILAKAKAIEKPKRSEFAKCRKTHLSETNFK